MSSNFEASAEFGSVRTCGSQQQSKLPDVDVDGEDEGGAVDNSDPAEPVVTDEATDPPPPAAEGGVLQTTESREGAPDVVVVVSLEPKASNVHTDWNWNTRTRVIFRVKSQTTFLESFGM